MQTTRELNQQSGLIASQCQVGCNMSPYAYYYLLERQWKTITNGNVHGFLDDIRLQEDVRLIN